jgi:FlaA1/EpsC-like NDP-sugar epimerase
MYLIPRKRYLIFGGTGSLGKTLCRRITDGEIYVFSRDEAKHHKLSLEFPNVRSIIGDIRDYNAVLRAIRDVRPTVIINAAAMKQVPACEDFPYEAVQTNIGGTQNIVRAVEELYPIPEPTGEQFMFHPEKLRVLSISTDKACKPVNSYGMTKALQERIHLNGKANAIFNCVRYGNVLESTGSVIPVFKKLIEEGKDLPITDVNMTRFLMSLDQAVDLIFKALQDISGRNVFLPYVRSAKITDLADVMIKKSGKSLKHYVSGIRPGEKLHEVLISEEETHRTETQQNIYIIRNFSWVLSARHINCEYSSADHIMSFEELEKFLESHGVLWT